MIQDNNLIYSNISHLGLTHSFILSWTSFSYDKGGYLFLPSYLMRTHGSRQQQDAVKAVPAKQVQKVYEVRAGISFILFSIAFISFTHVNDSTVKSTN